MNQGGATGTLTTPDPNSLKETRHIVDSSQGQASYYAPPTGASESLSWTTHRAAADNYSTEVGVYSNSNFQHSQHSEPPVRNIQDGSNTSSNISNTNFVTENVPHEYSSYPAYPSTDPYGYGNTGYAGYYNNSYQQQQPSQSYPQPVGAYQSTGAPHQPPISSFQNTGSYAEPTNYSSTYYNPGDYQTSGGYTGGGYSNNQTNSWNQGSHGSYASQQYPSYTPESNGTYTSSNSAATSAQYQQHYKQWEDYYSQTEVSCAPGTEKTSTTSTSNPGYPAPGGYSAPNSRLPEPLVPSWRPESSSSELPSLQPSAASNGPHDGYWKQGASDFQNNHVSPLQSNFQKPLDSNPTYGRFLDQHSSEGPQGQNIRYPVTQGHHTQYPATQALNVQYSATQAPSIQYSATQTQNSQYPATQAPNLQYPSTQAPNPQYPSTQAPNPQYPSTQAPNSQYPSTQAPNSLYPSTQAPNSQYPSTQAPNPQYPSTQEPHVQYPATQAPHVQYPANHQTPQRYHSPLSTAQQTVLPLDSRRGSKLQIPTNPKIISSFSQGVPKIEKDGSATSVAAKPAYISVPLAKMKDSVSSHDAANSILKPGMFPKSLRGYVERALARCKNDTQMSACQDVMKEVITKATADGTLYTRDWDTEPLFPLPNLDTVNGGLQSSTLVSSLGKKRSPSRRSKSRWEPVSEVKPIDKPAFATPETVKYSGWGHRNVGDKQFSAGRAENKEEDSSSLRFSLSEPKPTNKNALRPVKRQRLSDGQSGADNGDASSDSDKEQSLTAYYAAAIALTDSPEEKRRRENRSKRFDKGQGNRSVNNHFRPKIVGAGNLYNRRATAVVLSKNFEDGSSRAVEDIDWDALTVKGTCQEIEKRYLRLTSAPDPATVRPEEVLEKAVLMVQNSSKNYLYKCDQLKSIRQDLTVQRIRNELTAKVYETHARLAIEVGDLSEYNQCQSQLKTLYGEGIKGCHLEFSAYHLLCVILHSNNNRDLLSEMSRLSVESRKDKAVKHALAVRAAVTSGNYVLFFRLYRTAPNLNTCLMDLYVEKMRYEAVKCMSRSYRPTIPVSYVAQVLGFASALPSIEASDEKDSDGLEECVEWLKAHGACLTTDNSGEMLFDSKASAPTLYMPEPDDAVSHGDASLAVNDFLTRSSS